MTQTKQEIIERINRLTGTDRTDELSALPKYKLCLILEELKECQSHHKSDDSDFVNRIGVSVKFSNQ